jgi:nitrogen PTS system EIIA component
MTDLSHFLAPEAVEASFAASSKKALFQQLATLAARHTGLPAKHIATSIGDREKTGSTGFGSGVAIPHGKLEGLDRIYGLFVRLAEPLNYDAVDRLPVDLVFLMLSPPDAGAEHLKALAQVSRALRDKQIRDKLRGARSNDAIYAVLAGAENRDAA